MKKILGASVIICASLLALAATPGMGQDDPEPQPIGNAWSVSYPAPKHGERRGSHQILWSLAPAEHEYLSPSQTAHVWGDRYGLYAIRLSRGIGHEGTDRAYIIDVDGQGYGFTLAQGTWRPDPGVGSALQSSGDLYVLEAGPPGALDLHGLWTYRFYQGPQAQHGHLASITDPFGNTFTVSPPDFQEMRITVVDPTGRTTYLYFSASPGPYDEVIFTRSELDPLGDAYGIARGRASLPPLTTGARWGSDLYGVAPSIDAEMLVGYTFGVLGTEDSATVSWGPRRVDYTFDLSPSQNMTSSASVRVGSLQPRTLSYTLSYFDPLMVGINAAYGTGALTTHSLFVAQPRSGDPQQAIAIFETEAGMHLFEAGGSSRIEMDLNPLGLPTSISVRSGQGELEAELTWTDDGNLTALRDYRGKDWSVQWNNHRPVRETDPTGFFLSYGYGGDWFNGSGTNPLNARSSIADRAENTWRLNYLSDGRLAEVWEPNASAPSRRFYHDQGNAVGWLSRFTDASGRITDYPEYTEFGLPSRVRMYPLDNPATPDVIEGGTQGMLEVSIERNLLGDPTAITYSDGATVSIQYEDSFPTGILDERGRQFYFDYNPPRTGESGLLHRVRAPAIQDWEGTAYPERITVAYGYDDAGHLSNAQGGNGVGETFFYGPQGELTHVGYQSAEAGVAIPRQEEYHYDPAGWVRLWRRPSGTDVTIVRNENGDVIRMVTPSRSLWYDRDDAGRVTRAAVRDGEQEVRSIQIEYDYLTDRVNWLEHTLALVPNVVCRVSYTYFPNGRVATETLTVNQVVRQRLNYQYDGAGNLISILDDTPGVAAETTQYSYDGAGRLVEQSLANGVLKTVFEYGNPSQPGHGALRGVFHMIPPQGPLLSFGAVIASYTYTRYPDSRPESAIESSGYQPVTVQWKYDPYCQLRAENRGGWTNFTYDAGGNLTGIGSRTLSYYTNTNQLASDNGATSYTYDPTGARSSRVSGGTSTTYAYDFMGNLTEVRVGGNLVYAAAYDALGQRVQQTAGGQTTYLVYDLYGDVIAEVNSSGALVARYVWGPAGPVYRVASPNTRRYYLHDGLGNVRLLVTSSGQVTDRYTYDAWGKPTQTVGTTPNPFRWCGQFGYQYVAQTGLYHVGAREYDPVVARWLQRDPIGVSGGNPNTYVYCNNSPTWYVDSDGAEPVAVLDTTLDVASVIYDGIRLGLHLAGLRHDPDAAADMGISVGCMFLPYANAFMIKAGVRGVKALQKVLTPVTKWITCLPAGALVVAAAGMTPVEQLEPGDLVIGRTEAGFEVQAQVQRNASFIADELVAVTLDGREVLEATPSHPVWRVGSGWTQVGELQAGDRLATRTGEVEVGSVSRLSGPALVFNLSVEAPHTYFTGSEQLFSHNKVVAWLLKAVRNHHDEGIATLHALQHLGKGEERLADLAARLAARGGPGEAHHLFPKQFKDRFSGIGIVIDRYILRVPKEKHRLKPGGLHTGPDNWNKWWRDFWEEADRSEKPPSKDEVMDYLEKMKKRFGLDW